jgi:predicted phage replisome organizer/uncharacterized phage protein (TIGR02220 family)
MADNKKYYYLKLKDNFFDSDSMIVLESMPDGYLYSNILLKLYLRSLKNEGKLMFNDRIPYNSTILAQVVRHNVGVVEKALKIFKELDLIEIMDNGAIYILDIQNFIGHSSSEADRIREYRNKVNDEKGVQMLQQTYNKCTPEIEIELEKELELKKDLDIKKESCIQNVNKMDTQIRLDKNRLDKVRLDKKKHSPEAEEILSYLNLKSGSNYRLIDTNLKLIDSILKKGYTKDDCMTVINKKVQEWSGTDMQQYLRPLTLFSSKFDAYLNQPMTRKRSEFETTQDNLKGLYDKFGGDQDGEERSNKNIFDI